MSNYWRLRCLTCSDDISARWNHGDEPAKMIAKQRGLIGSALDVLADFDVELELRVSGEYLDTQWLRTHKDHDVRAADEYGKVLAPDGSMDMDASTPQAVEWAKEGLS